MIDNSSVEDIQQLVAEVKRLRSIYSPNHSFDRCSRQLLQAAAFLQVAALKDTSSFQPYFAGIETEIPLPVRLTIARHVEAGSLLGLASPQRRSQVFPISPFLTA
jgi:hypothetical protein